jgi:hypothetical protein
MDFTALWPFVNNAGASVLFIVFLYLNHKRTELDHLRTMQRDEASERTIQKLLDALTACTNNALEDCVE